MAESVLETPPQVGDHVLLVGTSITGDVQRVGSSSDHGPVTFKVDAVGGWSSTSKTARALQGTWITCPPELLTLRTRDEQESILGASTLDAALRALIERLVAEFAPRYSRKRVQRTVEASAKRYADARITAYVPILVYRDTRAILAGNSA